MNHELPELIQLTRSHFNEKGRWGLDYKKIPHRRITVLPGVHRARIQRLSGQPQVPVLHVGQRYIAGSSAILEELERLWPTPPLYPDDPAQCEDALAIQAHFDENVGPQARKGVFSFLLDDAEFFSRIFGGHLGFVGRKLFQGVGMIARSSIRREVGLTDQASVDEAYDATARGLEFVVEKSAATGYLVGDQFSIADLTAAALLALTVDVGHPAMRLPEPWPESYREWLAHWRPHPGTDWVRAMYDRHRGVSAAVE
jgi:glutathione S-transferase